MPYTLQRPAGSFDPAAGVLLSEHFQMAYVTNDIEQALDLFTKRFGVREFCRLEGPTPAGGQVRAEFAWVGSIMYEIISASGPGAEIFSDRIPAGNAFELVHHHLGYLIQDQQQWDGLIASVERCGWTIPSRSVNPLVEVCFVTVPGLPHYLEYLFPTPAGLKFFEEVPRN